MEIQKGENHRILLNINPFNYKAIRTAHLVATFLSSWNYSLNCNFPNPTMRTHLQPFYLLGTAHSATSSLMLLCALICSYIFFPKNISLYKLNYIPIYTFQGSQSGPKHSKCLAWILEASPLVGALKPFLGEGFSTYSIRVGSFFLLPLKLRVKISKGQ